MCRQLPPERPETTAGFTLIEALVALAVVAASIGSIGALMAVNVRGTQKVDEHLGLVEAMRSLEADLQDRAHLAPGTQSGDREGIHWAMDVSPYPVGKIDTRKLPVWMPQRVATQARSPAGGVFTTETIRLVRTTPP